MENNKSSELIASCGDEIERLLISSSQSKDLYAPLTRLIELAVALRSKLVLNPLPSIVPLDIREQVGGGK